MAKKSHAKRNHHSQYAQDRFGDTPHGKGRGRKRKHSSADVVELSPHSENLETSYANRRATAPLSPKNPAQKNYIQAIKQYNLTFGLGPAGTGKSYCAGALAAQALESGQIERIILTRPAV
jgi:phosphate starvation-inducible PhoH-like protein